MISPNKQNIKMIHINKTAGTSVVKWLLHLVDTGNKQHLTGKGSANSSHRIIEKFDDKHFYFTIVRNPYDRLASHYFHWESQGRGRNERWWRDDVKDLNDFVRDGDNLNKSTRFNAIVGRYILTPDIFDILKKIKPSNNGEIQITDALLDQAKKGKVIAHKFKGDRFDCGNVKGYLDATNHFAKIKGISDLLL